MCRVTRKESSAKRGYGYKWQQARKGYLAKHPLCARCKQKGQVNVATVVDHIKPHKQDMNLFWDKTNWQSVCKHCHDSYKQRLEKSGVIAGCSSNGMPIDPNHHWNT